MPLVKLKHFALNTQKWTKRRFPKDKIDDKAITVVVDLRGASVIVPIWVIWITVELYYLSIIFSFVNKSYLYAGPLVDSELKRSALLQFYSDK